MKNPINLNEQNISIVEWLEKEMRKRHTFTQNDIELFEQAKEMDKEQKKFIFECGRNFQLTGEGTFEELYNEIFKSEIENQKCAEQWRLAEQLENEIDNL